MVFDLYNKISLNLQEIPENFTFSSLKNLFLCIFVVLFYLAISTSSQFIKYIDKHSLSQELDVIDEF